MSGFRFADVTWIHALWLVAAVAATLVMLELRSRRVLDRFVSRIMQSRLVRRTSGWRRLLALALLTCVMVLLVLALMRPQWGTTTQSAVRVDSQIMICLDVSKSMLAEDIAPNRLDRAKIEIDSLLGLLDDGQQVGLIAFAGKATVMCPMTTDFGFLRMILNEVRPSSVGLGGTRIGEAIQKAVAGFRTTGDVNRLILLVTDGEDHDSFPLEAAQAAKEKGIRIVSVGFGDESGSKIEITDPDTGARSILKDRSGNDVITRLDGETLREIAMETDGAYIPAGTGALDLESIYRTHIATLLHGSTDTEQRIVRYEAYQWPVLVALLFLLLGLLVRAPLGLKAAAADTTQLTAAQPGSRAVLGLAALVLTWPVAGLSAQPQPAASAGAVTSGTAVDPPVDSEPDSAATADAPEEDLVPREAYNRAVALINTDPDQAERYLNRARSDSGSDGELRYRALYNLGWVEVVRANALLQSQAEQALMHLIQAANRFREAVRVRPDSVEARHNLELVSLRILELTDALNQREPRDLESRLDEIVQQLRQHQSELQALTERTGTEQDAARLETYRKDFRQMGVTQRRVIADVQRFTEVARKALDALQQKSEDERSPQDALRIGQLANMLEFLDSSLQRLNQSHSLTRRLQGTRAFRRWAAGLTDAKRGRDQLRNPVETLGIIIADAVELADLTGSLAQIGLAPEAEQRAPAPPPWLTREYLGELQTSTLDRTRELEQMLARAAATPRQPKAGPPLPGAAPDAGTPALDEQTRAFLANVDQALPSIRRSIELFQQAVPELETGSLGVAAQHQRESIIALQEAWEWFFDIRRLIETIYRDEQVVRQVIENAPTDGKAARQIAPSLLEIQRKNITRSQRLDGMLSAEREQASKAASPAGSPAGSASNSPAQTDTEQQQAAIQRLELARTLLEQALQQLQQAAEPIEELAAEAPEPTTGKPPETVGKTPPDVPPAAVETANPPVTAGKEPPASPEKPPPTPDQPEVPRDPRWLAAGKSTAAAVRSIEELRRLFFSLVEHLRDTAQRQTDLNDDTSRLSGEPLENQTDDRRGPLASRQTQLQRITEQIATALSQQSQQAAASETQGPVAPGQSPQAHNDPAQAAEKLAEAADLVDSAHNAMKRATEELQRPTAEMADQPAPMQQTLEQQKNALQHLLDALALLDNAQQQQQNQQQQNQQQQNQQQQQSGADQDQQQRMSANQLLQLIRDREAKRRKDKEGREMPTQGGVDKDW